MYKIHNHNSHFFVAELLTFDTGIDEWAVQPLPSFLRFVPTGRQMSVQFNPATFNSHPLRTDNGTHQSINLTIFYFVKDPLDYNLTYNFTVNIFNS